MAPTMRQLSKLKTLIHSLEKSAQIDADTCIDISYDNDVLVVVVPAYIDGEMWYSYGVTRDNNITTFNMRNVSSFGIG